MHLGDFVAAWHATLLALAAVLLGRMLAVYGLTPLSNLAGERVPTRWQHLLVWGGIRGALSLALALSLPTDFPGRTEILTMTFGVVAFTIVAQGLTIKPLIGMLGLSAKGEDDYDQARVQLMALSAAQGELDAMLRSHAVTAPIYERLRRRLEDRRGKTEATIEEIFNKDEGRAAAQVRAAERRLLAAEKSSIEQALRDGLVTQRSAAQMLDEADQRVDEIEGEELGGGGSRS